MLRIKQRPWLAGMAVGFGVLLVYLATLTGVHTFDAYSYAAAVQTKPLLETFHPHHILYGPLGSAALHVARWLGYAGPALLPLQIVNAVAGALGVLLWLLGLRRLSGRWTLALLGAGLLGTAFAWWRYAVEVEVYTLATLFLIAALLVLLRLLERPTWRAGWAWLGLLHAGAMLFHQTNVLWAAVVLAGWWLAAWPAATSWRERWRGLGLYALMAAALVGGIYALVMFGWSGFRSWAAVRGWLFEYAATGFWGGPLSAKTVTDMLHGWSETWSPGIGAGVIILSLLLLLWRAQALWRRWQAPTLLALLWLLVYGVFFTWWEADNIEFWIASLPPLTLLLVLSLATLPRPQRRWAEWATAALVLTLLLRNGWLIKTSGDPATDADRRVVTALAAAGAPDDLYIVPNGLQELYLRFEFAHPNVLPLSLDTGNWARACPTFQAAISDAIGAGYHVWINAAVLDPPAELLERYHLDQAAVRDCWRPFDPHVSRTLGEAQYALLSPLPAQQPAWHWRDWTLGWLPNFIDATRWDGGWSFIPGADPHFVSPPLRLDAGDWRTLEVTLTTSLADQHAQFYWIPPGGGATEAQSISWPLIGDGQPHLYRLDLAALPSWRGPIAKLRLDPVTAGAGQARTTLSDLVLLP